MRVSCPKCRQRFDVGHLAVLHEAERLKDRAKTGRDPHDAPQGNVLDPTDAEAARQRAEALRRRGH